MAHEEQSEMLTEKAKALYTLGGEEIKSYVRFILPKLEAATIGSIRTRKTELDVLQSELEEIEKHLNKNDFFNNVSKTGNLIDFEEHAAKSKGKKPWIFGKH